ncbi:MAG: HAD family hydrolase [Sphingobacteriales bacterium]|nr:MAG: HAD family hydrolase [Sphingobacteriales bacterium]
MVPYKHYSFDLWLTLIKSNPRFKKQRSIYFHQQFNSLSRPLEEVEHIFRQVDVMCNTINERTGKNIDADEMYLMVISQINRASFSLHDVDMNALYQTMEVLLLENAPLLYCDNTANVLSHLKDKSAGLNILSNTGFIKGITLRKVLSMLGIIDHFDFQLYSDETGYSKPNKLFFDMMLQQANGLRNLTPTEIIHVGDNSHADIGGAKTIGIHSLLINSNNTFITKLLDHVPEEILTA